MTANERRASLVEDFVASYAERTGLSLDNDGAETVVADLVGDLMHYTAVRSDNRLSAIDAVKRGIMFYVSAADLSSQEFEAGDLGPSALVSIRVSSGAEIWTALSGTPATVETVGLDLEPEMVP
jgi:hypothetical protein